ncbi:hypothetical protein MKX03_029193 [Papaver bracteatum]|nr:hypothetical protein MKX03_029193 [Papaver bracteatum]
MNQISSRFSSVCRSSSLFRKNPLPRWSSSSKPISSSSTSTSSLISNTNSTSSSDLITVFISKPHHQTFNYSPPKISGNHFRKFSGDVAAECNFSDKYLKSEISEVRDAIKDAKDSIDKRTLHPLDAIEILMERFNALMKNLGIDERFREEIEDLEECVDETVAFGEYVYASGGLYWSNFQDWFYTRGKFRGAEKASQISNFGDDDHLKKEISEVQDEQWNALENVELGKIPPLDAVKDLADKFDALMEKLGFHYNEKEAWDDEDDDYVFLISHYGEFPEHLKRFKKDIRHLQTYADMTVAYGEFYVAAGGAPAWGDFENWWDASGGAMFEKEEETSANQVLIASLKKSKINSMLMKELIEDFVLK